jgi:excinuclease ABC subunit C
MQSQDLAKYKIPESPGVYFFVKKDGKIKKDDKKDILYIGKATCLRDRVKSYFSQDLTMVRGNQIRRMIEEASGVLWQECDSVLEALLLESYLIKKHKPRYNSMGKDDKSYNHVVITKEQYPRVLIIRGKELEMIEQGIPVQKIQKSDINEIYGPFTSGSMLKQALRLVRKIFPFRDTCIPQSASINGTSSPQYQKLKKFKPCFNAQLGLCPGVCDGSISLADYRRNIRNIKLFFKTQKSQIKNALMRDMKKYAKAQEFERAGEVARQLQAIDHIQDIALLKRDEFGINRASIGAFRIEAYDIAHTSGTNSVGVMVVVENGEANKSAYRMFKIKNSTLGSDTSALKEVLERRLAHYEWRYPDMIVMDGGRAQINVAKRALEYIDKSSVDRKSASKIAVVGVVKDNHHKPSRYIGNSALIHKHEDNILLANSEAHRFALKHHRNLRGKMI